MNPHALQRSILSAVRLPFRHIRTKSVAIILSRMSQTPQISPTRRVLDRLGFALVVFVALVLPLLIAFIFFLGVKREGIFLNEGDPLRQGRIWMQHERRGPVGLGLQTSAPENDTQGQVCVRATITFLRWNPYLALTREVGDLVC